MVAVIKRKIWIYTHAMKRKHDDSADEMAELAGLTSVANHRETSGSI